MYSTHTQYVAVTPFRGRRARHVAAQGVIREFGRTAEHEPPQQVCIPVRNLTDPSAPYFLAGLVRDKLCACGRTCGVNPRAPRSLKGRAKGKDASGVSLSCKRSQYRPAGGGQRGVVSSAPKTGLLRWETCGGIDHPFGPIGIARGNGCDYGWRGRLVASASYTPTAEGSSSCGRWPPPWCSFRRRWGRSAPGSPSRSSLPGGSSADPVAASCNRSARPAGRAGPAEPRICEQGPSGGFGRAGSGVSGGRSGVRQISSLFRRLFVYCVVYATDGVEEKHGRTLAAGLKT